MLRRRWRRGLVAAMETALRLLRTVQSTTGAGDPRTVVFLIWNAYSIGGTVRTVIRQANELVSRGHDVEVVSVIRRQGQRTTPFFDLDRRVRLTVLVDLGDVEEPGGAAGRIARWLHRRPSVLLHEQETRFKQASLLTDVRAVQALARQRAGVVIGTRLGLNLIIARFARPGVITIAQEHLFLDHYRPPLPDGIQRHFPKLDAVVSLTEADAEDYRRHLAGHDVLIETIPNSLPDELPATADAAAHRIVAVGRLASGAKGFDRLIKAFAKIADRHPDWDVRIIGAGQRARLDKLAAKLGISDRVSLPGSSDRVMDELRSASVLAVSSRFDAFPMIVLEGMSAGLAIVSFDCPQGPREMLTHDVDALVAPQDDLDAFAAMLDRAMGDEELRRRLGVAARETSRQYSTSAVTERWLRLFEEVEHRRRTAHGRARQHRPLPQQRLPHSRPTG